jgi:hypothetical protein
MTTSIDKNEEKIIRLPPVIADSNLLTLLTEEKAITPFSITKANPLQNDKFDSSLDFIIDHVKQESLADNIGKSYYLYIKQRKWRQYKKCFELEGGKIKDNDPDHLAIGPSIDDYANAQIDQEMVMPITSILDP